MNNVYLLAKAEYQKKQQQQQQQQQETNNNNNNHNNNNNNNNNNKQLVPVKPQNKQIEKYKPQQQFQQEKKSIFFESNNNPIKYVFIGRVPYRHILKHGADGMKKSSSSSGTDANANNNLQFPAPPAGSVPDGYISDGYVYFNVTKKSNEIYTDVYQVFKPGHSSTTTATTSKHHHNHHHHHHPHHHHHHHTHGYPHTGRKKSSSVDPRNRNHRLHYAPQQLAIDNKPHHNNNHNQQQQRYLAIENNKALSPLAIENLHYKRHNNYYNQTPYPPQQQQQQQPQQRNHSNQKINEEISLVAESIGQMFKQRQRQQQAKIETVTSNIAMKKTSDAHVKQTEEINGNGAINGTTNEENDEEFDPHKDERPNLQCGPS